MARGNMVELLNIQNEDQRQAVLQKRKEACIKRLQDIRRFCRAEACMIICDGPNDLCTHDGNVWPSRREAATMLARFMSMSQRERNDKVVRPEKIIQDRLGQEKTKLEEIKKENDELEMEEIMNELMADPTLIATKYEKLNELFMYIDGLKEKMIRK